MFSPFLAVVFDVNITQYGIQEQPPKFGCLRARGVVLQCFTVQRCPKHIGILGMEHCHAFEIPLICTASIQL